MAKEPARPRRPEIRLSVTEKVVLEPGESFVFHPDGRMGVVGHTSSGKHYHIPIHKKGRRHEAGEKEVLQEEEAQLLGHQPHPKGRGKKPAQQQQEAAPAAAPARKRSKKPRAKKGGVLGFVERMRAARAAKKAAKAAKGKKGSKKK